MNLFSGARFRSSLRHFLLGRVSQGLVSLAFTLLAVRLMPITEYGGYLVVLGLVDLLGPVSSLGVVQVSQQFLPEMAAQGTVAQFRRFVRRLRVARWLLQLLAAAALYLGWEWGASALGFEAATSIPAALPCLVVVAVLAAEFVESMLEALLEQKSAQLLRLAYAVARLAGLLVLAQLGNLRLTTLLWVDACAAIGCWLAAEIVLRRRLAHIVPSGQRVFTRAEVMRYGWHSATAQLLNSLSTAGAARLVVARVLGLDAAGQFGFMQSLVGQLNRLLPSVLLVNLIRPMLISARLKGEKQRVADACGLLWKSNLLLVWPLVPLVYLGGDALVSQLSGNRIQHAGLAMTGMALAMASMAQAQVNATVLAVHRASGRLLIAATLTPLVPLLAGIGALHYSIGGAALGIFAAFFLRSAVSTWLIQSSPARMHLDTLGALAYVGMIVSSSMLAWLSQHVLPIEAAMAIFLIALMIQMPLVKPLLTSDWKILQSVTRRQLNILSPFVSLRRS